jgi:2-(1,2-epoxy-1,2-dihydrophenyl)acetyl-CoA isomerase
MSILILDLDRPEPRRTGDGPPVAEMSTSPAQGKAPVILVEVVDRVGTITLNRPERHNALNGELIGALDSAVRLLADDDDAKVVILTGAGQAEGQVGFCSGGDVKDGAGGPGGEKAVPVDQHAAMLLHLMPKPTIAMVGGPAVGAGCSLAAACDLRFAAESAQFWVNFTPNGLTGDYGGTFFWTAIGGTALARRLYLLNERVPAPRALDLGMVHAVLAADELRAYTYEVARQLARTPASLLALVKDNLNEAEDEASRRRWLFAHEADNQLTAARATLARRSETTAHTSQELETS